MRPKERRVKMMRRTMVLLSVAGFCLAAAASERARAEDNVPPDNAPPKADEIRLTLKMSERSISFVTKLEPLARRTIVFEGQDHAPTDAMRAAVAELAPILAAAKAENAFVVTAYAADPIVAYRRARAVRGELIERHQISAARLVAAGRAAPGHVGGAAIVDVHEIDPAACSGCGPTPFRSIAYDSGALRLVTMLPERTAAAQPASRPVALPLPQPRPALPPAARPAAPIPAPREARVPAPRAAFRASDNACVRPRIVIDDYYRGGPLVDCRGLRRGARG